MSEAATALLQQQVEHSQYAGNGNNNKNNNNMATHSASMIIGSNEKRNWLNWRAAAHRVQGEWERERVRARERERVSESMSGVRESAC